MQVDKKQLMRRAQVLLTMALGAMPLLLALDGAQETGRLWAGPVLLGLNVLAALACFVTKKRYRLPVLGLGVLALVGAGLLVSTPELSAADIARPTLAVLLLLAAAPMVGWRPGQEPSPVVPIVCGSLYLAVYSAVELKLWEIEESMRSGFDAMLLAGFLLFVLLTLLSAGRATMDGAAAYGKVPESMRRRTNALVVGLMALVTGLAGIPVLKRWLEAAVMWLRNGVMQLVAWIAALFVSDGAGGSGGGSGAMALTGLGEDAGPSELMLMLEKMVKVLAMVLLAALSVVVLWKVLKGVRKLIRRLLDMLARYTAAVSEDYVDEVASTLDDAEHENASRLRRKRRARRRVDERTLSPAQRVRYRYQSLLARHPDWPATVTARDTLSLESSEIYERARYSDHPVTEEDAVRFETGGQGRCP